MLRILFCVLAILVSYRGQSQCINSFPFTEDFESNNGNWVSGGTGNDWAWGSPVKPVVNSAAGGSKCWVVGGLSTSFYTFGERSYIQSPCFDFSSLLYPYVSFSIFWECERTYDGTNIQSSIDGGVSWQNVGSFNEPPNCMNANWYNTSSINNLSGLTTIRDGWSGNIQSTSGSCQGGSGSGGWVTARHCIGNLAGEPNVIFRFTFGAGTQCNNYDGVAIDDFTISNSPPNTASFSATCTGVNTYSFSATFNQCPDNLQWTFGDGSTATGPNSSHTYSAPGIYTVSFSAGGPCNAPAVVSQQVEVIALNIIPTDAACAGASNGKAVIENAQPGYSFVWSTVPVQTSDTAFNLVSGNYTVTVTSAGTCSASASVSIGQGSGLNITTQSNNDTCNQSLGSVVVNVGNGSSPFQYVWSVSGNTSVLNGLSAGTYSVTVSDDNNCTGSASSTVNNNPGPSLSITTASDTCSAGKGSATVTVINGSPPYQFLWSTGSSTSSVTSLNGGSYDITVSDNTNCTVSSSAFISNTSGITIQIISTKPESCYGQNDGSISLAVSGGQTPYTYQWNNQLSDSVAYSIGEGSYLITVIDAAGCTDSVSVELKKEECDSYIYFPTAFSPNGDGANDTYKPKFSQDLETLSINIYNRWGELVYSTNNFSEGWDGIFKGVSQPMSTYVYSAEYKFKNSGLKIASGNLTLLK